MYKILKRQSEDNTTNVQDTKERQTDNTIDKCTRY